MQARIFDIGPTLMAAAGLAPPQDIDGLDLMADSDRLPQTAFTVCYNAAVARRGDMKLIRFRQVGRKRLPPGIENRAYLYDLASDPMETTDVADLHPMIFDALQQELRRHLHRARVEIEGSERLEDDEIDSDVRQRLEALGYID